MMKNRKLVLLISFLGIVICCVGAYLTYQTLHFLNQAVVAEGVVVDFEKRRKSRKGGVYAYYAIVEFSDQGGARHKFVDPVGARRSLHIGPAGSGREVLHKTGEKVDVLYMLDNPEDARIDRGIMNWAAPIGSLFVGFVMLFLGVRKFNV